MLTQLKPALLMLLWMTLLTGVIYPFAMTGIAQGAMPKQANGSLLYNAETVAGSSLIGQEFSDPKYFWGRLSGTAPAYNAAASSGSNYGPLNPALKDMVQARIDALKAADPGNSTPIPVDLVTASGSGLDPHISPAAASYQAARVARVRGIDATKVEALIAEHTEGRTFGILGEPTVNVLELNRALDTL
jgi:K+-transporting ATPase ATPase C chain